VEIQLRLYPSLGCIVVGFISLLFAWLSFKLFQEYGWTIFRLNGGCLTVQRMNRVYNILTCLLRLDVFFFVEFALMLYFLVLRVDDIEGLLLLSAIPVSFVMALLGVYAIKIESNKMMIGFAIWLLLTPAYLIFKTVGLYHDAQSAKYFGVMDHLMAFGIITMLVRIGTAYYTLRCVLNFGKGFKMFLNGNLSEKTVCSLKVLALDDDEEYGDDDVEMRYEVISNRQSLHQYYAPTKAISRN